MRYLQLGHSGLKVAELCLGTMTFGEELGIGADEGECRKVFDAYVEAGGNCFDTANIYNRGTSERMLGKFVGEDRDRYVVATKYTLSTRPDDPNAGGSHRKNLVCSLEDSLRRLDTDYVDLYWIHGWDRRTPVGEVMRALDDQVRLGKVLHIGVSNAPAWWVATANTLAAERGLTTFTALQLHYNLLERSIEADFPALAASQHMAITSWSPLAGGLLTGKFDPGSDPTGRAGARLAESPMRARTMTDVNQEAAAGLSEIAGGLGYSPAQVALAWQLRHREAPVIPIIGARKLAQLEENLGATALTLESDTVERLNALKPPPPTYPKSLLDGEFFRVMMWGQHEADLAGTG
ncbi:MAG: aldo/keto reductase [Chromatiales bacterium]|nr:MAG: aldo/keto reductase [Chromatiales bacterium]